MTLKPNWKLWTAFLAAFVSSSCASGPKVSLCAINNEDGGFWCKNKKGEYFLTFEEGKMFSCMEPSVAELWLKSCIKGKLIQVTKCEINIEYNGLKCFPPEEDPYFVLMPDAVNYLCMSRRDFVRVEERCGRY